MNNYKIRFFFASVIIVTFSIVFFVKTDTFIEGLRYGLSLCGSSVIPSLFPFIVLSDYIVRSDFSSVMGNKITPITEKLFRLPGSAGCAIIMSLIGGFPIGAKMTAQLFENEEITQKQGRRMLTFCVNSGPAFVIGTVGTSILSSKKAGIILLASTTIPSLAIGIISRFFSEKTIRKKAKAKKYFNFNVITDSISQSIITLSAICAWIILFSGISALISQLPISETSKVWLSLLTEVTNGCINAAEKFPACIIALALGWSGLAIHCQLLPYLTKLNMKLRYFWISRIVSGGVSCALAYILFKLFPCDISVFASSAQFVSKAYSVSVPVSVSMMLLSALMLIDIKTCTKEKLVI